MEQPAAQEKEEEEEEDGESWNSLTPNGYIWVLQDTSWKNGEDSGLKAGAFQKIYQQWQVSEA